MNRILVRQNFPQGADWHGPRKRTSAECTGVPYLDVHMYTKPAGPELEDDTLYTTLSLV